MEMKFKIICAILSAACMAGTLSSCQKNDVSGSLSGSKLPEGALPGEFSVGPNKKIHFSKGNLQATVDAEGKPTSWAFAGHQYDFSADLGANTKIGSSAGVVDLFSWIGESGSLDAYGVTNEFYSESLYGSSTADKLKSDWGTAIGGSWRTLTREEWDYLINERENASSLSGYAKVMGYSGFILLPDGCKLGDMRFFSRDVSGNRSSYQDNTYFEEEWAKMESLGAVFLPASEYRVGDYYLPYDVGYYWSSTAGEYDNQAYNLVFNGSAQGSFADLNSSERSVGYAVRLVTE